MPIKRGHIYFVQLDPVVGKEMGGSKRRPVLVLSINDINQMPLVVTVVPGTKAAGKPSAFRNVATVLPTPTNGLSVDTNFQCHQIRAIDHSRFSPRPTGWLSAEDIARIEEAVKFSLGLL